MRELLEEIQRRKDAKEDPCNSCDNTGREKDKVCAHCLGQGILLTEAEYKGILEIAGYEPSDFDDDAILDQEFLD